MVTDLYRRVFSRRYIHGYRLHHGLSGLAVLSLGILRESDALIVAGLILMLDDVADFPWWTNDERLPWLHPFKFGIVRLLIHDDLASN